MLKLTLLEYKEEAEIELYEYARVEFCLNGSNIAHICERGLQAFF